MISLRTFELSAGPKSAKIVSVPANGDIDSIKDKILKLLQIEPDHSTITFHTTKNKKIDTAALPTNESVSSIGLQDNSILILRKKPDLQLHTDTEPPVDVQAAAVTCRASHPPVAISLKSMSVIGAGRMNVPTLSVPQALRPLRATEEHPATPVPLPEEVVLARHTPPSAPQSALPVQTASLVAHTPPAAAAAKATSTRAPLPPSPTSVGRHKHFSPLPGTEKFADTPQLSELKQKVSLLQAENGQLKEKLCSSIKTSARLSAKCEGLLECQEGWHTQRMSLCLLLRQINTLQSTFHYQNTSFVEKTHEYLLTVFFSKVEQNDLDVFSLLQHYGSSMDMLYSALSFQFKLIRTPKYEAVCHFLQKHIPELACAVPVLCHLYYNREPEFLEELFFTMRGSRPSASTWVQLRLPHGKQLYYSVVCRFAQPLCPAVVEETPCACVDITGNISTCPRLGLSNRCAEYQRVAARLVLQTEIVGAVLTGRDTADALLNKLEEQNVRMDSLLKETLL